MTKKKVDSLLGALDLLVLKVLDREPGLHGYAILAKIRVLSDSVLRVEEGSLYPALHRMKEAGWLRSKWSVNEQGRRTRQYRLTARGKRHLQSEQERWQSVSSAILRVLQEV